MSPHNLLDNGRVWCVLTSGFLHKNIMHLFFNSLGIFIFGCVVEHRFGFMKTLMIYIGALVISMAISFGIYTFILNKNVALIGASGALMGLISVAVLSDPFLITYETLLPVPVMLKGWMFLYADVKGLLGGEADGVSHIAHLAGFLSITFIVYFLDRDDRRRIGKGFLINVFSFALFLALNYHFNMINA